jgi:hypothetical protein
LGFQGSSSDLQRLRAGDLKMDECESGIMILRITKECRTPRAEVRVQVFLRFVHHRRNGSWGMVVTESPIRKWMLGEFHRAAEKARLIDVDWSPHCSRIKGCMKID